MKARDSFSSLVVGDVTARRLYIADDAGNVTGLWDGTTLTVATSAEAAEALAAAAAADANANGRIPVGAAAADINSNTTTISGGKIRTGKIQSTGYDGPDGAEIFADAGAQIDLDNSSIITTNFRSTATGAAFRGDIEADSLSINDENAVTTFELSEVGNERRINLGAGSLAAPNATRLKWGRLTPFVEMVCEFVSSQYSFLGATTQGVTIGAEGTGGAFSRVQAEITGDVTLTASRDAILGGQRATWKPFPFNLGLAPPWANLAPYQVCQYMRSFDRVYLRGTFSNGQAYNGSLIGVLPEDYRPADRVQQSIYGSGGDLRLIIFPDGIVRLHDYSGRIVTSTHAYSFDNLSFSVKA